MATCHKCDTELNNENWYPSHQKKNARICKECTIKATKRWQINNRKLKYQYDTERRINNRDKYNEYHKRYYRKLRLEAIAHYSPNMTCTDCGEDDVKTLSIDHINGGGTRHLKAIGGNFYQWLRKNKYPNDFRVLCMNCNWLRKRGQRTQISIDVIQHYSDGTASCKRCGNKDIKVLSIDHIDGGGNRHKREVGMGVVFLYWLKKNNYPRGYQVLCMNCQFKKER